MARRSGSLLDRLQLQQLRPFTGKDILKDGEGLTITLLAGGRPKLLGQMLVSLEPVLDALSKARRIAYLNQQDDASAALLDGWTVHCSTGGLTPIGYGYSTLAREVGDTPWWLHLEDDWKTLGTNNTLKALREGTWILTTEEDVVQIRLRYWKERVLTRHMVTGQSISWNLRHGRNPVAQAHWTFNPSLQRGEIATLFREELHGEQDAQHRVHEQCPRDLVVQLVPGAFTHIGKESLRQRYGQGPDAHGLKRYRNR